LLPGVPVLPTLARGREPWSVLLATLAELHRHGADLDWPTLDQPCQLATTTAPSYPFERQCFWLDDPTLQRTPVVAPAHVAQDQVGDERVWGFYDQLAEIARGYRERPGEAVDGHLTFGLLDAPEPGFSWIRTLFDGPETGAAHALLTRSQREIKKLAFAPVDLNALRRVMDFGCGHGADLITLAERAPHLELHGFTISARQVAVGRERAAARGLAGRVHIHHGDSARNAFPGTFDLIFGFEVAGLIEDKAALFANIGAHLAPGGVVVMADFVATADRIAAVDTASFTPTAADWAELLSGRRLRITSCVDTSVEVANFLDDPGFTAEVDRLVQRFGFSELTRRHLLSNHNIGQALRRGLMRYVILAAHHEPSSRPETLQTANEALLRNPSRRTSAPAGPTQDAGWFYRAAWRRRPIEQVAESHRDKLERLVSATQALDAMARHFVRAADLTTVTPAEPWRRLHAHLLRTAVEGPADAPTPPPLPEAALLMRCGPELRAVLEGHSDPLELLFPGGDQTDAVALYRDSPFTRAANAIAAEAMSELLADRGPARVIEVGAGTGGTTQALLGRLRAGDQYLFTDVSPAFVTAGKRRFGLDGQTLDLERPLAEQGIEPHTFDIVVAANVLHATRDLVLTLAGIRELLRPDGALLLIENGAPMLWGDLTFGLTDGMWRFTDLELRPDHALLPEATWNRLLVEAGFTVASVAAGTDSTAAASGLLVFLARRQGARVIREAGLEPIADATDVIDTRALQVTSPDQMAALVGEIVEIARAAAAMPTPPRLWFITQWARAVLPGERTTPAQAALFGLANTLALEHPELRATVLDVDDPAMGVELVRRGTPETRLAMRQGQTHVLRLRAMTAPAAPISMRADATYVIIGGMGGVGVRVAEDLVAAGACHLVLAGPRLREVRIAGAQITTIRCDVTDESDVRALMATLESHTPPVRGLFHVAGALDDAVLAGQTPERIARVLAPKVTGADLLDRLSRGLPLDHFVLFSSSAALLGSAAQANHAAANGFL
ncbi:MAG: SDR family NAD(P)-dependent oxidoreductase, partial [Geminicoccaceae bacterium]